MNGPLRSTSSLSWGLPAALLLLALSGCLGEEEAAPAPTGRIDGAVVGNMLNPYGNLTVTLVETGATDVTSPLGGFTFGALAGGLYHVTTQAPGVERVTVPVTVFPDHVSPVILQLLTPPPALPPMHWSGFKGHSDLALPGNYCLPCGWTHTLSRDGGQAEEVYLEGVWHARMPEGTSGRVILELWGPQQLIAKLELPDNGQWEHLGIPGHDIPQGAEALRVMVRFSDDFLPQPVDMEGSLRIVEEPADAR